MPGLIGKQLIREDHPVDYFTATAGQSSFTLSRAPGAPNAILVFVNGVVQRAGTNYTLNGASLTINSGTGLTAGSAVLVWYAGVTSGAGGLSGSIAATQATGTGDAQVASFVPSFTSYFQNMVVEIGAPALSVTSTPTVNVDGLGVKRIFDNNGNDPVAGAIGGKHIYIYDTTLNSSAGGFRLINPLVNNSVPVGSVIQVLGNTPPSGFLKLNGALVSRALYPALWSFAQASGMIVSDAAWLAGGYASFSTGDLSTTFRIPDYRGEFIRGWDDGRGVDSGRTIGTNQVGTLVAGDYDGASSQAIGAPVTVNPTVGSSYVGADPAVSTDYPNAAGSFGAAGTTYSIASYNYLFGVARPRNVSLLLCVKY